MIEITTPETRSAGDFLKSFDSVLSVNAYGDRLHVAIRREENGKEIVNQLKARGFSVEGERWIDPSLEDVFIAMTKGDATA
jgi:ABC-type uncharacterized transport system ATPase subunit